MKKAFLGIVIVLFSLVGCSKEDEGYDPFGTTAEQNVKKSSIESSNTTQVSQSVEREMFLDISREFEADNEKKVSISGETLPGATVTFWAQPIMTTTADSKGNFTFVKDFISISNQSFKVSAELKYNEESTDITLKPNKEYIETLKKNVEQNNENAPNIPSEFVSAANKAKSYSDTMHMSKAGIYDQLVSEHGEKFSPEAAQYAIDNVRVDYNSNALEKAKDYRDTMDMAPEAIREQLVSEHGEKFTVDEADYAIQNLN